MGLRSQGSMELDQEWQVRMQTIHPMKPCTISKINIGGIKHIGDYQKTSGMPLMWPRWKVNILNFGISLRLSMIKYTYLEVSFIRECLPSSVPICTRSDRFSKPNLNNRRKLQSVKWIKMWTKQCRKRKSNWDKNKAPIRIRNEMMRTINSNPDLTLQ